MRKETKMGVRLIMMRKVKWTLIEFLQIFMAMVLIEVSGQKKRGRRAR
jgi:hypothetical protein